MRRPTPKEQRELRRFFWGDRRGLAPVHFAINTAVFLVVGVIVVADGYIVVGLLIAAFGAFCGYATVLRWRRVDRCRVRSVRRRS
jgi:hypothetical protein